MADGERCAAIRTLVDATLDDGPTSPVAVAAALERLGLDADERERLAAHVLRVQREHARLRRREHELAALFSSAHELAELRDSDAVLSRLVTRAHEMMGADVTYLSEFDPVTRELLVRVTSGSVSAAFRHLRVPAGAGLVSVIVETRAPHWVRRYADYESDRHERAVDDAVAAEGLVAMLGVPMLAGGEVLGALFVANREEYAFTTEEIALLSALADHASAVLQTARILHDLRRSEDETRQALERLTEHLGERDRANTVHQELVQAVLAGGGFAPVAATLASALGRTVTIVDGTGRVITAAGRPPAAGVLRLAPPVRDAISASRRSGHCVPVSGVPGVHAVAALTAGAQFFGAMLLGGGDFELGAVDRRTVERAAQVGALLALQQDAVADAEQRVQTELVADILDAVAERRADVERRARRFDVDLDELDALVLFAVPGEQRSAAARALVPFRDHRTLVGEYRGYVVATYPSGRVEANAELMRSCIARAIRCPVLAVTPPPSPGGLPAAVTLAMRTARLLTALGVDEGTARTDDYLPYSAVLDTDARTLSAFLDGTIGAVRRYDTARGTDLLGTLRAFVRTNASPTRTARTLRFHTNTILQRLERLDTILGAGWRDDERLFRIGIATRLDELGERLRRTDGVIDG